MPIREDPRSETSPPPTVAPPGEVVLYVDGGCQPNPGPGGYGVVLLRDNARHELSGGFRQTTNNRMEILAVIVGLRFLNTACRVTVYSDSQYVVKAMSRGWARRWKARNWHRTPTETAVNPDLWDELLTLCGRHQVTFKWVRGHAGNALNERCDQLAVRARSGTDLPLDPGYPPAVSLPPPDLNPTLNPNPNLNPNLSPTPAPDFLPALSPAPAVVNLPVSAPVLDFAGNGDGHGACEHKNPIAVEPETRHTAGAEAGPGQEPALQPALPGFAIVPILKARRR